MAERLLEICPHLAYPFLRASGSANSFAQIRRRHSGVGRDIGFATEKGA
jgi:hypothetical protein